MLQKYQRESSNNGLSRRWSTEAIHKNKLVKNFVLDNLIFTTYRFAKIIFSSCTECSLSTLTALTTVFPVPVLHSISIIYLSYLISEISYLSFILLMIGYISKTFLCAMSSGNFAYTTLAFCLKVKIHIVLKNVNDTI